MTSLRRAINELANDLHEVGMINKITLRQITENDIPVLFEYTPEEIQEMRKRYHLSQAVFAKYLNISLPMVKSLEVGQRKANGAILRLLNIVDSHGVSGLIWEDSFYAFEAGELDFFNQRII